MNHDFAGYALYIMCLQKLAESKDRTLTLDKVPELAFDFRCQKELLHNIIKDAFEIEGNNFFSTELNESLTWFDEKHNKASEAGKRSAESKSPEKRSKDAKRAADARWHQTDQLALENTDNDSSASECETVGILSESNSNNRNTNGNRKEIKIEDRNENMEITDINENKNNIENRNSNTNRNQNEIEIETGFPSDNTNFVNDDDPDLPF